MKCTKITVNQIKEINKFIKANDKKLQRLQIVDKYMIKMKIQEIII